MESAASRTVRSPRPRRGSRGFISWIAIRSMRHSTGPRRFPAQKMAASKYDPSCPSPEGSTHNPSLDRSFRQESGRATATLSRVLGDVHRAEDAVQEAYLIAMKTWARDGVPANTAAWIITTAKNRAIDALRRDARGSERVQVYAQLESAAATIPDLDWNDVGAAIPDDRLALIFACCHPALAEDARVALTLRAVCGLSTD